MLSTSVTYADAQQDQDCMWNPEDKKDVKTKSEVKEMDGDTATKTTVEAVSCRLNFQDLTSCTLNFTLNF